MNYIQEYTIPHENLDLSRLLDSWNWLIGEDKSVVALTKLGDVLLKDSGKRVHLLDIGRGTLRLIKGDYLSFINGELSLDEYDEIFLGIFINKLESNNMLLKSKQVYAFNKLPIVGGRYNIENIYIADVYEYLSQAGKIHSQIRQ